MALGRSLLKHTLSLYNCVLVRQPREICLVSKQCAERPRNCTSVSGVGKEFISSLKGLDWLSAQPNLLYNWYPGLFAWENKQPWCQAYQSPLCIAEVRNECTNNCVFTLNMTAWRQKRELYVTSTRFCAHSWQSNEKNTSGR